MLKDNQDDQDKGDDGIFVYIYNRRKKLWSELTVNDSAYIFIKRTLDLEIYNIF